MAYFDANGAFTANAILTSDTLSKVIVSSQCNMKDVTTYVSNMNPSIKHSESGEVSFSYKGGVSSSYVICSDVLIDTQGFIEKLDNKINVGIPNWFLKWLSNSFPQFNVTIASGNYTWFIAKPLDTPDKTFLILDMTGPSPRLNYARPETVKDKIPENIKSFISTAVLGFRFSTSSKSEANPSNKKYNLNASISNAYLQKLSGVTAPRNNKTTTKTIVRTKIKEAALACDQDILSVFFD